MTQTLAQLHLIASAVMDTNHPGALDCHRFAGTAHQSAEDAPDRLTRDLMLTGEAGHLLNAVYCVTEGQPDWPLTAAERLLVAAIIASRANDDAIPLPPAPNGPYGPALAEAFREGARGLLHCNLGDKIEVQDGAPVREATDGDGGVWVQGWLFVTDEDRANMPGEGLYNVVLTADGLDVTAESLAQAERFAVEDAREFAKQLTIMNVSAALRDGESDDETEGDMVEPEVACTSEGPKRGEGTWTFTATFELDVWATSEAEAVERAQQIMRGEG